MASSTLITPPASLTTPTNAGATPVTTYPTGARGLVARYLFGTTDDVGSLVARLALAGVFFPHGAQKVLGWFGGHGFGGTYDAFTQGMGIPAPFALAAILTELLAPIALLLGLGSRLAAAGIAVIMVVATLTVHLEHGFFMNWFGDQKGEGFEYHILAFALALVVVLQGGGRWALDRAVERGLVRA